MFRRHPFRGGRFLNDSVKIVLQRLQIFVVRIQHRIEITVPVPDRKPENDGSQNGLIHRHINIPPDSQFPRAVYVRRVVNLVGNPRKAALDNDHIIDGIESRNDVYPESVEQPRHTNDQIVRDKSAAEKHGENIYPIKDALEFEIGPAHRISHRSREDKRRRRAQHRPQRGDEIAVPKRPTDEHHFVIFKGQKARQKIHAALRIVRSLIEGAYQDVPNGVKTAQAKQSHQNRVNDVERIDMAI